MLNKALRRIEALGEKAKIGELLEEGMDGGHRVLVFSQFTTMLALIKDQLAAENIEFCYLDGAATKEARHHQGHPRRRGDAGGQPDVGGNSGFV